MPYILLYLLCSWVRHFEKSSSHNSLSKTFVFFGKVFPNNFQTGVTLFSKSVCLPSIPYFLFRLDSKNLGATLGNIA